MDIGMIGLGKMGGNMTERLLKVGHRVTVYDVDREAVKRAVEVGATGASSVKGLVGKLVFPRIVWLMVPAGEVTEKTVSLLAELLSADDILVDGGNSNYKDTLRRAKMFNREGIHYVDVGTSGGVWGLTEGYSMMVGGDAVAIERLRPILESLAPAPDKGWGHVGPPGAGHFVKMIHNGIEYGLMQAYAEGFEIMKAKEAFNLDLHQVAEIWRYGSVIRSWLLDLTANALAENQELTHIEPWVADSGEGRWTVFEAVDLDVPAPIITLALQARFVSREEDHYAARLLAAMRNQFGGHEIKQSGED